MDCSQLGTVYYVQAIIGNPTTYERLPKGSSECSSILMRLCCRWFSTTIGIRCFSNEQKPTMSPAMVALLKES